MNTQRLTQITVGVVVVAIAAVIIWSRMSAGAAAIDLTNQPVYGDSSAPIQVVMFEDFLCPHCAVFTETVLPQLKREFADTGLASFHFINFPVIAGSEIPATVAECVYRQDNAAFWDVKDVLMRSQAVTSNRTAAFELARDYAPGIDADELNACIADGSALASVRADGAMATTAGATGTPAIFVNGRRVNNYAYETVASAINAAR